MRNFRTELQEGECKKNHGCNVASTCMCALAEDAIDEVERLRSENKALRTMLWLLVDDAKTLGTLLPMTVKRATEMMRAPDDRRDEGDAGHGY